VYSICAENGTAGNVELNVEIGHEFTGNGMIDGYAASRLVPPPQGASLHAYLSSVV
jgi:hypothetical protein